MVGALDCYAVVHGFEPCGDLRFFPHCPVLRTNWSNYCSSSFTFIMLISGVTSLILGGVYMRKLAPARVSHWDDFLISYRVHMMTGSLFNGTFHADKIHVWFKIANITHELPVPVYRQTDFTPKWVIVLRLQDTVARFRTGVKFSPRCENRGKLTPG